MIVVDRIEGARAVLEIDGETVDVPASILPPGAKEGTCLAVSIVPSDDAAASARLTRLRSRTPQGGGDFTL